MNLSKLNLSEKHIHLILPLLLILIDIMNTTVLDKPFSVYSSIVLIIFTLILILLNDSRILGFLLAAFTILFLLLRSFGFVFQAQRNAAWVFIILLFQLVTMLWYMFDGYRLVNFLHPFTKKSIILKYLRKFQK